MATAPHVRSQGLGRRIIEHLEAVARDKGAKTIVLNARDSAVGFYAKLGYEIVGPGPTLFDVIPHVKMCKRL
jgi:ribosomal protein S18 acetylase RimI-like enzyme